MKRPRKTLFASASALLSLFALVLAWAPPARAVLTGPPVEDCTFCASYLRPCGVWDYYAICYEKMSGPGTCPPCGRCTKMWRDQ